MLDKTLTIIAKTVNGEIMEFPSTYTVKCGSITPVGKSLVRAYDEMNCIIVVEVYLVRVGLNVLGTEQFSSLAGFETFINGHCSPCNSGCDISYDGCVIYYDGCNIFSSN